MDLHDQPGMDTRTKYKTQTVLVIATTAPPALGFRFGGWRVEEGEKVRLPIQEAKDLERRGKCRIIYGSEETVLM